MQCFGVQPFPGFFSPEYQDGGSGDWDHRMVGARRHGRTARGEEQPDFKRNCHLFLERIAPSSVRGHEDKAGRLKEWVVRRRLQGIWHVRAWKILNSYGLR
jgi:hypothetical protein